MQNLLKKSEMLQIAEKLEIAAVKSKKCFDLYEEIAEKTLKIAKSCVNALECAKINISPFGFSYREGRYFNYLVYNKKMLEGWKINTGGYDGGDFNSWIPATSPDAVFECAQAIENGLIDGILDEIERELNKRSNMISVLDEKEAFFSE